MVWEQRCGVVVMLTQLRESHSLKATCYWPDEGRVKRYGSYLVCHKNTFSLANRASPIVVRSLLLKECSPLDGKTQVREVILLQYEGWPDFGVPSTTQPICDLIRLTRKFQQRAKQSLAMQDGPVVVHCSAGVGRTGVFVAADITIQRIQNNQLPDIKKTVQLLRKQRNGMVKNEQQYQLIYSIVGDFFKQKEYAIDSPKLQRRKRTYGEMDRTLEDDVISSPCSLEAFLPNPPSNSFFHFLLQSEANPSLLQRLSNIVCTCSSFISS